MTEYFVPYEINDLQTRIMVFIDEWVRKNNTPVPRGEVIRAMKEDHKTPQITTAGALNILLNKGFIRRGYTGSNKTTYVQLRGVPRT